jgi:hypothetical protein
MYVSPVLGRWSAIGTNGSTGAEITRLEIGDVATFTDSRGTKSGIRYAANYTGLSNHSLVHKAFVTGITNTLVSKTVFNNYTGSTIISSGVTSQKEATGTSYTILTGDRNYVIYFTNAAGCLVTIPNLSVGFQFNAIRKENAGTVTFTGSSVNLKATGNQLLADKTGASWIQKTASEWYGFGGLATQDQVVSATNGLSVLAGNKLKLGGILTGATTIGLTSNNLVFTGTSGTVRYGSDLSASYNVRSFVDKGFVTGITNTLQTKSAFNSFTGSSDLVTTNRRTVSYTLALTDRSKLVEMNVTSGNTITVPPNSGVSFTVGSQILCSQYGSGQTTFVPGVGVTLRSEGTKNMTIGQYSLATLIKIATNEWY